LLQTDALWANGERGRAAEKLAELDPRFGTTLPSLRVWQARFWEQDGLRQKARDALLPLAGPDGVANARRALAQVFGAEGWTEDRCRLWRSLWAEGKGTADDGMQLAACQHDMHLVAHAIATYQAVLEWIPYHREALRHL